MLALSKTEWHTIDDHGNVVLTDSAPAHVVKDYNDHVEYWKFYLGVDYYIYPHQFVKMRQRLNYTNEQIKKELIEVYSSYELAEFRIKTVQDIFIKS